ncbi:MAG: competence protein ComK [Bacillus sp. (in: firmicutes)]
MGIRFKNLVEEYEVNAYTTMIRPMMVDDKVYSEIMELDEEYTSPLKPLDIIKNSCNYFGCQYDGRRVGTKSLTGYTHKAPIAIEPSSSIYFFPTTSPEKESCVWIAQKHIASFAKKGPLETVVTFSNKQQIDVPVSYSTFENQLSRTSILKLTLDNRIAEVGKKYYSHPQSK